MEVLEVVMSDPWALETDEDPENDDLCRLFREWLDGETPDAVVNKRLQWFREATNDNLQRLSQLPESPMLPAGGTALVNELNAAAKYRIQSMTFDRRAEVPDLQDAREADAPQLADLFRRDTVDYWRLFEELEHFLQQPELLGDQVLCQIPTRQLLWMVEKYYSLDDDVVRELLPRKLASSSRKGLDDVAEAMNKPLKSVRRQFDNLRRIYNSFDEQPGSGFSCFLVDEIMYAWLLSQDLAAKYACLLFLFHSGFKINLSRRTKLSAMRCHDFEFCAASIMSHWVEAPHGTTAQANGLGPALEGILGAGEGDIGTMIAMDEYDPTVLWASLRDVQGVELAKQFVSSLRDIKIKVFGDRDAALQQLYSLVRRRVISDSAFPQRELRILDQRFRSLAKALLTIGSGLAQLKEFRDLFEDLLGKVLEPLFDAGLSARSLAAVLTATAMVFPDLEALKSVVSDERQRQLATAWRRFVLVAGACCVRMASRIAAVQSGGTAGQSSVISRARSMPMGTY